MESTQDVTSFDVEENPVSDPREDDNKIKTFFKEKIEPLLGLFLIIFDYICDLDVGIGLYRDCHYNFAAISFFFTALPSMLVLLFVTITCLFPNLGDNMTSYVKEVSGLDRGDLIGLVICFPLYMCIITIRGRILNNKKLGAQTIKGTQLVEILAESMPQFLFTCYIRVHFGPDFDGFISRLTGFDGRLFSVMTAFGALWYGLTMTSVTNMGLEPLVLKKVLVTAYYTLIDVALLLSMAVVFIVVYGIWTSFGVLFLVWFVEAAIHWKYFDHYGFESLQLAFDNLLGPLLIIAFPNPWEKYSTKFVYFNTLFLYGIYASILISITIGGWDYLLTSDEQSRGMMLNQDYNICTKLCGQDAAKFDCSNTWYISSDSLMTWNILNWSLWAFCLINLICNLLMDLHIFQFFRLFFVNDTSFFL